MWQIQLNKGIRNMNQAKLSLEQQFNMRSFNDQVSCMSREQAQECLIRLYEQMMIKDTMYKDMLRHQWGLE